MSSTGVCFILAPPPRLAARIGSLLSGTSFCSPLARCSNPAKVANEDCRQFASFYERIRLARSDEERPFRLPQPKSLMRLAPESICAKRVDDFLGCAGPHLNFNSRAAVPKTDAPTSRIRVRVKVADVDIGPGSRHPRQLAHDRAQIPHMPQRERAHRKIESGAGKGKVFTGRSREPSRYRTLPSRNSKHCGGTVNSHSQLAALCDESFQPPACAASQVEDRFVAKVGQHRQQMAFFTRQEGIRNVVVGRSPPFVTLRSGDAARTTMRRKLGFGCCEIRAGLCRNAHRLSALGFRNSITCCIHLSSQGAP
jgi:hypothetical protein